MTAGILLAGGSSQRFGKNKLLEQLGAKSVIARSYENMVRSGCFDYILLVCPQGDEEVFRAQTSGAHIVVGGKDRTHSVLNALDALKQDTKTVAIHDGARPFAPPELFKMCVRSAREHGSGIAGYMCVDTLKYAHDEVITSTLDRTLVAQVQTPQAFDVELLRRAYEHAQEQGISGTDDAYLLELIGHNPRLVSWKGNNLKITYEEDMKQARTMLAPRIGHGYDVHAFAQNRQLVLGGVGIDHEFGLAGHSDADVLIHALMDALLGAAALGDIGSHFPDTDAAFLDIDSRKLLRHTAQLISKAGYSVGNVDCTLVLQKPKIAPHIPLMRKNIADDLGIDITCVNVAATTTERLGFEGRCEGVSAHAVCILV